MDNENGATFIPMQPASAVTGPSDDQNVPLDSVGIAPAVADPIGTKLPAKLSSLVILWVLFLSEAVRGVLGSFDENFSFYSFCLS